MRRRVALTVGGVLAAAALLWTLASVDRCGHRGTTAATALTHASSGRGPLRLGAALRPLAPPLPTPLAGYGPLRTSAHHGGAVAVRALVLEAGTQRFGLVAYDALLVPSPLVEALGTGRTYPVWVAATHTHSSLGGFDARLTAQLAGVGRFRPALLELLEREGRAALDEAEARLEPVHLDAPTGTIPGLTRPRSGTSADDRLTVLRFTAPSGAVRARWLIVAAHPTLVPSDSPRLDPDYPGVLARLLGEDGAESMTIVLQGAGGNASAIVHDSALPAAEAFARSLLQAAPALAPRLEGSRPEPSSPSSSGPSSVELAVASARVPSPRPDASRLAPRGARALVENVLCADAASTLEVSALRVGSVVLLALPLEPTHGAGTALEALAGATRALGNTNGYEGYLEEGELVLARAGESPRQYFDASLLERIAAGARLVGAAVAPAPTPARTDVPSGASPPLVR